MKTSSLQFKVLLLVASAMAFVLAVSIFSLNRLYGSIEELDRVAREDFQVQQLVLRAHGHFKQQVQEWKNVLLRGREPTALARHWAAFEAAEKDAAAAAREARAGTSSEQVRTQLQGFIEAHKAAGERYRKGLEAYKAAGNDPYVGDKLVEGVDRLATTALLQAVGKAEDNGARSVMSAVKSAETVHRLGVVALVAAMLLALVALWLFMRRAVLDPLKSAARFAERISQGDLTAEIRSNSRDEAGQLMMALGRMNTELATVVSQVRSSAEAVVTASEQVSAGTTDLSQRTEEQASSLEETAASMEELASTVRQNADNAHQADELARNASKRAEQGGREVVNVVVTMGDISASAKRIADIISVIDGIAFQTNILALNAAVEAARAGEQGRGFAVVASEVRSLAQRSAQAAKEIKDLIGASVGKVEAGTRLVEQAGDTIQALVIDVKRVSELMESIAEASAEQSRGVQQVNKTVTQMDKVVQQNAAAVQESASAADGMRRQAEALVHSVSTFQLTIEERIDAGARHAPRPAAEAEPAPQRPAAPREAARSVARGEPARQPALVHRDEWEEF
ncbi:MAG TPA: methyl-accepting chemotaxis protein [Usitatibacter sp.]|nr:methyl-accepting chemotaxis protein [Usitatibacter sp.]